MRLQHSLASVLCFSKLRWKSIPRSRESVQFACWILNRAVYRFAKCAQVTLVNCTFMRGEPSRIKSSPDSWGSAGPQRGSAQITVLSVISSYLCRAQTEQFNPPRTYSYQKWIRGKIGPRSRTTKHSGPSLGWVIVFFFYLLPILEILGIPREKEKKKKEKLLDIY